MLCYSAKEIGCFEKMVLVYFIIVKNKENIPEYQCFSKAFWVPRNSNPSTEEQRTGLGSLRRNTIRLQLNTSQTKIYYSSFLFQTMFICLYAFRYTKLFLKYAHLIIILCEWDPCWLPYSIRFCRANWQFPAGKLASKMQSLVASTFFFFLTNNVSGVMDRLADLGVLVNFHPRAGWGKNKTGSCGK